MIRIATIGTSMITSSLLEVLKPNSRAVFVGTCSRDAQRAEAFTQAHGGDRGFSSVEDLAASSDVDAVYIGSPNAIHYSQALACVRAGKHVLVEKPVCANQRQAAELFDEAAKHNVVALEAMRPLHDPALRQIRDALPRLDELFFIDHRGVTALSRCDGQPYMAIFAERIAGALRGLFPNM